MNISHTDISAARIWAETHAGEDDPLDVFAWKLLDIGRASAEKSANFHDRDHSAIKADMAQIEARFSVEPEPPQAGCGWGPGPGQDGETVPNGDESIDF